MDYYIIPHEHLIEEFVEKGLPREKVVPIGIPVDEQKFSTRLPKSKARAQFMNSISNPNLRLDGHWYLVMSGSMGYGNVEQLIEQLLKDVRPEDSVVCVCGRNENLLHSLQEQFSMYRQLCLLGFTNQVSVLMDAADVVFTKPGGITSTEAIVKNIPLIHTHPIPGLENHNAHFFHLHGMSYFTTDIQQQVAVAKRLCEDTHYRKQMLSDQRANANPHSSDDVINLIIEDKNRSHKPPTNNET
jgi:processive 1,2-diacylglycerol beta-glucosyltransferase